MKQATRAAIVPGIIILILSVSGYLVQAQQRQRQTTINADGSKDTYDATTGITETDKNGKTTNLSAASVTQNCNALESDPSILDEIANIPDAVLTEKIVCDNWAVLQPRTQIEQLSFARLITRLMDFSPPVTDFARYRGMELKSEAQATLYDATVVPNDLGKDVSCTILQAHDPSGGMLYVYQCSIKTLSYPAAIELEKVLVPLLSGLHFEEDQVAEHGFAVSDKDNHQCAPTGECAHAHMYQSVIRDNKFFSIEATPDFTRDPRAEMLALPYGHDARIDGIASDSATVSFAVISHGPDRAGASGQGQPTATSNSQ
ncbi:MAG: hypothetical protein WA634_18945 [Silvibacterium sp.]